MLAVRRLYSLSMLRYYTIVDFRPDAADNAPLFIWNFLN
jgi:hypothetical protein